MPSSDALPLHGLQIVELHAIGPVPFAGKQLAMLGADVLRISPPVDPGIGLPIDAQFDLLNTGKRSTALNLKTDDGRAELLSLLSKADVLIEGFRPGVLERLKLEPKELTAQYPQLVIGRLSGFGSKGALASRAGHDINYLALSGILNAIGSSQCPAIPLNLIGDFGGGAMHLAVGVLARLVQRSITGRGGTVNTSILAGSIGLTHMVYGQLAADQWNLERQNNLLDGGLPFYRVYATLDQQFVAVGALENKFFRQLLGLTNLSDVIDPVNQYDESTWPKMAENFSATFATRTRDQWAADASKLDCCVSPVLDFREAAADEHNLANGWFTNDPFEHPQNLIGFGD